MSPNLPPLEVGTRINHSGHLGTVRFSGPVNNTSGLWLGIEWDDPARGKHDGVKDGQRYFSCSLPGSGSFIRPSASISRGVSFLQALNAKYVEALHGDSSQEKITLGSSQGTIQVEAVHLDKVRSKLSRLHALREISLDQEKVAICDEPGKVRATCPGVQGLDLSQSLLPDWEIVARICIELPSLERLALNQTRLVPLKERPAPSLTNAFLCLKELQLNGTLLSWHDVQEVIAFMPVLNVIEMGYNHLNNLAENSPPAQQPELETVNLEANGLKDWESTMTAMKCYTSLQRLILASNHFERILAINSIDGRNTVPSLKHLSLSSNRLKAWSDIDALIEYFPHLETLTINDNPIADSHHARPFIIAMIPSLMRLDSADISPRERRDSELFYLSYLTHFPDNGGRENHSRWNELSRKHNISPDVASPEKPQNKMKSQLIEIHLHQLEDTPLVQNGQTTLTDNNPTLSFRVLPTMSLRALKRKICKSCRVKNTNPSIDLRLRMANDTFAQLQGNDDQELSWWGVENGSTIAFVIN